MKENMLKEIQKALYSLREKKPVVLNLTNFVTMDFVANSLLAVGAAPIMSQYEEELDELVSISSAIYINIGTLDNNFLNRITQAINSADRYKKPIILDPVGSGATQIRTTSAKKIANHASIIRGNASEIISLTDSLLFSKGVETANTINDAKPAAIKLANTYKSVIAISGEIDFITNGETSIEVPFGSNLMPLVTGMGCSLTAVIAAFRCVIEDSFEATKLATQYFTLCGELTSLENKHPASFKISFLDQLHASNFKLMEKII
ncbi:hydroxyethylthiazole kinase [Francisella frigiditurris]|uniref:Hydroxyethylthiazole kinase n=1 Tax=Francisella frigiditurris TaxID=1542390 RepID=A0A1J0KV11_9GAMM|nr:hydroxyethylthiazole kinase [Francisella frigiditurris]APC97452.1 hydroxyethylthiazole kinase family protein [Francisella frigiditurris]